MNTTDTVFLQTVGKFIATQVQLAVVPLEQLINEQKDQIKLLEAQLNYERENTVNHRASVLTVIENMQKQIEELPSPVNGKDGEPGKDAVVNYDMIHDVIAHSVEVEIAKFSVTDGQDGEPGKDGADGRDGKDGAPGKDADDNAIFMKVMDAANEQFRYMSDMVKELTEKHLAKIVQPKDGKDGKDGKNGLDGKDGKNGIDGQNGKDGANIAGTVIDRRGCLVLNLSNGETRELGTIVGRDGKDGEQGAPGKDGRDGFGFDNFEMAFDGERTYTFVFTLGELKKEFTFIHKNNIYQGIWRKGLYQCGDSVTYDGSTFIAKRDTESVPATPGSDWQLAVKRGREGKQGEPGKDGSPGKAGRDGRDLTQLAFNGEKY